MINILGMVKSEIGGASYIIKFRLDFQILITQNLSVRKWLPRPQKRNSQLIRNMRCLKKNVWVPTIS